MSLDPQFTEYVAFDVAAMDPATVERIIGELKAAGDAAGLRRLGQALEDHAAMLDGLAAQREEHG
jgi:hypothetical protein